jgi:hypothetical protein
MRRRRLLMQFGGHYLPPVPLVPPVPQSLMEAGSHVSLRQTSS